MKGWSHLSVFRIKRSMSYIAYIYIYNNTIKCTLTTFTHFVHIQFSEMFHKYSQVFSFLFFLKKSICYSIIWSRLKYSQVFLFFYFFEKNICYSIIWPRLKYTQVYAMIEPIHGSSWIGAGKLSVYYARGIFRAFFWRSWVRYKHGPRVCQWFLSLPCLP